MRAQSNTVGRLRFFWGGDAREYPGGPLRLDFLKVLWYGMASSLNIFLQVFGCLGRIFFLVLFHYIITLYNFPIFAFPGGSAVKNPPVLQETQEMWVQSLGQEEPMEKGMATDSSILAEKIPWTEEPGRLQSMGLQRVRHS